MIHLLIVKSTIQIKRQPPCPSLETNTELLDSVHIYNMVDITNFDAESTWEMSSDDDGL